MPPSDLVALHEVTLKVNRDMAGLYETDDGDEFWIPWSQVKDNSVDTVGETGTLYVPRWIAESKDLEYDES